MMGSLINLILLLLRTAFSVLFFLAVKLRLTIPFIYILLLMTIFSKWSTDNEKLSIIILFSLVACSLLSWIFSLTRVINNKKNNKSIESYVQNQILVAKQLGIDLDNISFNEDGDMIYISTGEQVLECIE